MAANASTDTERGGNGGGSSWLNVIVGLRADTTTKNAAKTPQINKRNRLPLSALRCHRDRLSTTILASFLVAVNFRGSITRPVTALSTLRRLGGIRTRRVSTKVFRVRISSSFPKLT